MTVRVRYRDDARGPWGGYLQAEPSYIYQSMLYASAGDATPKTKKDERL